VESGLLYTFSTIAQALGGAFALLAAFVLYRFQSLDKSMWEDSQHLKNLWPNPDHTRIDALRVQSKYAEINRDLERVLKQRRQDGRPTTLNPEQPMQLKRFQASVRLHQGIKRALWAALLATFIVMAGSVAAIPHAHEWAVSPCLARFWMGGGVVGFVLCLILYLVLIWAALRGPPLTKSEASAD
jgi:hypothetical protein